MVDRKQLDAMIRKVRAAGATVEVTVGDDGHPTQIAVAGLKGCGPHPMPPIAFSEAMHRLGLGVGMNGVEYAAPL